MHTNFLIQEIKLQRGCWVNYNKRTGNYLGNLNQISKYVRHLSNNPIGSFPNLNSVASEINQNISPKVRQAILFLILNTIDDKIQQIFSQYLKNPLDSSLMHQQKIGLIGKDNIDHVSETINTIDWVWLQKWIGTTLSVQDILLFLSNFAYTCRSLNFRTTYHCNSECKFCYNFSGPTRKNEKIPLDIMLDMIKQMPEVGLKRLIISGGEPFLYPDNVLKLVKEAADSNLRSISILSNGFWGTTYDKAKEMLLKLQEVGFHDKMIGKLKVSNGVFHQEYIKIDGPLNIAKAYYDLFEVPLHFDYEIFPPSERQNLIAALDAKLKEFDIPDHTITIQIRRSLAIGRGEKYNLSNFHKADHFERPCLGAVNKLIVEPNKNMSVFPCCGQNYGNKGLAIGNAKNHSLKDLMKLSQNDSIIQYLIQNPITDLFRYLPQKLNEEYSAICNVCFHALSTLDDREPLLASLFDYQRYYPYWFQWKDNGSVQIINHFSTNIEQV